MELCKGKTTKNVVKIFSRKICFIEKWFGTGKLLRELLELWYCQEVFGFLCSLKIYQSLLLFLACSVQPSCGLQVSEKTINSISVPQGGLLLPQVWSIVHHDN